MSHNDLTFFTNEPERNLYERFNSILKSNTQYFDVLVGYFRTSGFHMLYPAMKNIDKIRILVGLNVDNKTMQIIEQANDENIIIKPTHREAKNGFVNKLINEMENSEDDFSIEQGVYTFVEWLIAGKIEMRIYTEAPLHAKVYIMRKDMDKIPDSFGSVITGSSNFSRAGLRNNLEFNVELKDSRDVDFALERFEEIWAKSIDIKEEYVDTITQKTWHKTDINPYEMFIKTLYEYFNEELNEDLNSIGSKYLPDGFMELKYQRDAVIQAKKTLEAYGGVFIADVVGLGKTYICALLAQKLNGHILIICPPVLVDMWQRTINDFDLKATAISLGVLEDIRLNEKLLKRSKYIFIDEAHRFRNQTDTFSKLHEICYNKKIVLISATPQNNYSTDIANQIYLFQDKNNSSIIPNEKNIELFFSKLNRKLKEVERFSPKYMEIQKQNSAVIRDKVLRNVLIRRTRSEITKYYKDDLESQGLKFPELGCPEQIVYTYDNEIEKLFNATIKVIADMTYARYKPLTFLKSDKDYPTMRTSQQNISGFMKSVLIKRLESSFEAFKKTLKRFIESNIKFLEMTDKGTVFISKKINVYDLLDENIEKLMEYVENEVVIKIELEKFSDDFIPSLKKDLALLKDLFAEWELISGDPKKDKFLEELKNNPNLIGKQMIIFTESKETAEYIAKYLEDKYKGQVLMYSGQGSKSTREEIEANYNPNYKNTKKDNIKFLVTTDVLAEGINLHRAGVIVNYDLPWNPTKVMQRVGRINRVGTKHDRIFVFNFFPTAQANAHLPLEQNIINKIQAFHDTLGEDFKYLSESEVVSSHNLYKQMTENLDVEEEGASLLEYLSIIRDVRDNNEELFEKVKRLPKKAKIARVKDIESDSTISFVKKGGLKRFIIADNKEAKEMTDLDALAILRADKTEKSKPISKEYFDQLKLNKDFFHIILNSDDYIDLDKPIKKGNDASILKLLKALKNEKTFTDIEELTIKELIYIFEQGKIPANISKEIVKESKAIEEPHKIYTIIKNDIPDKYFEDRNGNKKIDLSGEVEIVLSEYLTKGTK